LDPATGDVFDESDKKIYNIVDELKNHNAKRNGRLTGKPSKPMDSLVLI
jgi:hypothetical protein